MATCGPIRTPQLSLAPSPVRINRLVHQLKFGEAALRGDRLPVATGPPNDLQRGGWLQ